MDLDLTILHTCNLFAGIDPQEISDMLGCLSPTEREFAKDAFVLHEGSPVDAFGLVIRGSVLVIQEDFWGNRNIITVIAPGEVFAESYACSAGVPLGVNVVAQEASEILFLEVQRALHTCNTACGFHQRLIRNLVSMLAEKNLHINEKLLHISQRSTRDKLLSFLSSQSQHHGQAAFEIPFNRQQLADFLSVDRSAMSSELCKLRNEGILRFDRSHFELVHPQ